MAALPAGTRLQQMARNRQHVAAVLGQRSGEYLAFPHPTRAPSIRTAEDVPSRYHTVGSVSSHYISRPFKAGKRCRLPVDHPRALRRAACLVVTPTRRRHHEHQASSLVRTGEPRRTLGRVALLPSWLSQPQFDTHIVGTKPTVPTHRLTSCQEATGVGIPSRSVASRLVPCTPSRHGNFA